MTNLKEHEAQELTITGASQYGYLIQDASGKVVGGAEDMNAAQRFVYEEKRKAMDPEPWINPMTMERFAEEQRGKYCVHYPRIAWPEHGGKLVRRDYLRVGDRAVSSHYGARTVERIELRGVEGQTAYITWEKPDDGRLPLTEAYSSEDTIELLSE